jgi:ketosteroid isomerase-like protein
MKLNYFLFVIYSFILLGCMQNTDLEKERGNLIKTDLEFSKLSAEKNAAEAFYAHFAEDGIQLVPNSDPIRGRDAIKKEMSGGGGFVLTWQPKYANVSKSGDIGYTWGIYKTTVQISQSEKIERTGKYLTVWKKQKDGTWKVAADIGNKDITNESKK